MQFFGIYYIFVIMEKIMNSVVVIILKKIIRKKRWLLETYIHLGTGARYHTWNFCILAALSVFRPFSNIQDKTGNTMI